MQKRWIMIDWFNCYVTILILCASFYLFISIKYQWLSLRYIFRGVGYKVSGEWDRMLVKYMTVENIKHKDTHFMIGNGAVYYIKLHCWEVGVWLANHPYCSFSIVYAGEDGTITNNYILPRRKTSYELYKMLQPYMQEAIEKSLLEEGHKTQSANKKKCSHTGMTYGECYYCTYGGD